MKTLIKNAKIVTLSNVIENGACLIEDEKIVFVGDNPAEEGVQNIIDAKGGYLVPGFIDLHCHGGGGYDCMDGTREAVEGMAKFHLKHGTTTIYITTLTSEEKETENAIKVANDYINESNGELAVGLHLEGPWFNPAQCGAQNVSFMKEPYQTDLAELVKKYPTIKRVSVAPELNGAEKFIKDGVANGVVMSAGHTDADFATVEKSVEHGVTTVTHLYSGMKGVIRKNSFRIAGAIEAGLCLDDLTVEIIADGRHLPYELLRLIYKCKGADKICLITDSTRASGMADGCETYLGTPENGMAIVVEDGVAKLPDRLSFAGSTATMDRVYRTMAEAIGRDMVALSKMASTTPARTMGLKDRGEIAVGKRADLVLLDENLEIKNVLIKGELI